MPSSRANLRRGESKVLAERALLQAVRRDRAAGRTIVVTNGCFDLLHLGHVRLLERARRLGDTLVVALNSDRSVRRLKGAGRPLVPARDRARVLAALEAVDYVTIFDAPTPARLIERIRPHVLVKGADWARGSIAGSDAVRDSGGRVVRIPLTPGRSTSRLLARVAARRR
ncbi:MAG TPA: D-glycero-beta-D-manno-heptose 1-phosphate adenylyltransferase [bacterium]